MESAKTQIKINHVVYTEVCEVKSVSANVADGEWVHFEGSRESMCFPSGVFKTGDKVKITFERV